MVARNSKKSNAKKAPSSAGDGVASGSQIVVTGSSAGGIEALSALVKSLPGDFPAPMVIAQHLDPSVKSALSDIIAKNTSLAVRVVTDREPLKPGVIYVVPNNRNVKISDHSVLVEKSSKGLRPSVDLLFTTAAETFGEGVVAIVLSGMGSDGAVGARAVKRQGGTVIIQDPSTAMYPSMPQSLPPTSVDIVAKLESMGPLLQDLLGGTYIPAEPTERTLLRSLLVNIRENFGFDFSNYKTPTILRRLSRLIAATGCQTLGEYVDYLKVHPEEYQRLISSFLIKVTEFFRDRELFQYLRKSLLPDLVSHAAKNSKELRLWSAGCATGEEAYSLAIMAAESLPERDEGLNVRIFATDLDENAIAFARRGLYSADALKEVPSEMLKKYFVNVDGSYEVSKQIRSMTIFGQHDFAQRAPFPRIDLALCRNVLIYFTKELQQRALQFFAFSIRPEGYLVLGKSETVTPLANYFESAHSSLKVYRRCGDRVNLPLGEGRPVLAAQPRHQPYQPIPGLPQPPVERPHRPSELEQVGNLLTQSPLGVIIVDRHYDIQAINPAARSMLAIRSVAVGDDLIHLVGSESASRLRDVIDAAFRMEKSEPVGEELPIAESSIESAPKMDSDGPGGAPQPERYLQVFCHADKAAAGTGNAILIIADSSSTTRHRLQLQDQAERQSELVAQLHRQREELARERHKLLQANKELMDSNLGLRDSNERLLVSVEESQSSTEEIETLNEEMQATNEELETLNEELQATVEELNTTNDELEARTRELQTMITSQEEQHVVAEQRRKELSSIIDGLGVPVAALDARGKLMFVNEAYRKLKLPEPGKLVFSTDGKAHSFDKFIKAWPSEAQQWTAELNSKRRFKVQPKVLESDDGPMGTLLTFTPL